MIPIFLDLYLSTFHISCLIGSTYGTQRIYSISPPPTSSSPTSSSLPSSSSYPRPPPTPTPSPSISLPPSPNCPISIICLLATLPLLPALLPLPLNLFRWSEADFRRGAQRWRCTERLGAEDCGREFEDWLALAMLLIYMLFIVLKFF